MSEFYNVIGTSIISSSKRAEIAQIGWLTGGENFVSKRDRFLLYMFVNFQQLKEYKNRTGERVIRHVGSGANQRFLNVLKSVYLSLRRLKYGELQQSSQRCTIHVPMVLAALLILLLPVQSQSTEGTRFCHLIRTLSESDVFLVCSNIYLWYMADHQSRPEL